MKVATGPEKALDSGIEIGIPVTARAEDTWATASAVAASVPGASSWILTERLKVPEPV